MSQNSQFYFQSSIHNTKPPCSLKDQTLTKIAIQLCQYSDFKNHIQIQPEHIQMYSVKWVGDVLPLSVWADFITEQSSAICEELVPDTLKASLMLRIRKIAVRILIWYKEYELRLEMTPQVMGRFLMFPDWTVQGTLDEKKIVERLVQEEAIPVLQRYRLACTFFLEPFIRSLWSQIPREDRERCCYNGLLSDRVHILSSRTKEHWPNNTLVTLWSEYMQGSMKQFVRRKSLFWQHGFEMAISQGQPTAVTCCWEAMSEIQKQERVITAALFALRRYCESRRIGEIVHPRNGNIKYGDRKKVGIEYWEFNGWRSVWFAIPEHYRDIYNFLFSQMSDEQKFEFFQDAFDFSSEILECSITKSIRLKLELRTLNQGLSKLWNILPVKHFKRFLFTLLHGSINKCEYQDFDHEHLLLELLERTPDHYKTYLFRNNKEPVQYEDNVDLLLLLTVFKHNTFEEMYIELIQIILQQATVEEKHALVHSNCGSEMCVYFMKNNKLEAVDLILEYCLSKEEIPTFKKDFLASQEALCVCLENLVQENGEFVHLLFQWGNFSELEISEIKPKMIRAGALSVLLDLLRKNKLDCLDTIQEICLPSDDARKEFRGEFFTLYVSALCNSIWKSTLYQILKSFISGDFVCGEFEVPILEKGCSHILKNIFMYVWGGVECQESKLNLEAVHENHKKEEEIVEKWFGDSPRELAMDLVKKDVMSGIRETIFKLLRSEDTETVIDALKWYLSDIETAMTFKTQFEKYVSEDIELNYDTKLRILGTWDQLIEDQMSSLRNPRRKPTKGHT